MATSKKTTLRPALRVVARPHSFCRAGRCFTQEPTVIPLDDLTKEQIEALRKETMLVVTDTEIAPEEKNGSEGD